MIWVETVLSSLCEFLVAIATVSALDSVIFDECFNRSVELSEHGLCVFDNRLLIRNAAFQGLNL